ncbi:alpha/beta fold hydrolase [Tsukamurella soli]
MGERIRYAIKPGGAGHTPLLMLNGLGAGLELLLPLAQQLDGIETILLDVPGVGESTLPRHPYTLPMFACLIERLLARLGYRRVDVLGFSWGGMLAQQFAFQASRRCRRLVLVASMQGAPMVPARLSTLMKLATPRRFNDREYARRIQGDLYGGDARTNPPALVEMPRLRTSPVGYLFQQLSVVGWSGMPLMPFLQQQTLILAGDDDPIVPLVNAKIMARMIPRSRLQVLHDGHHFFRSSAAETSAAISAFLDHADPA